MISDRQCPEGSLQVQLSPSMLLNNVPRSPNVGKGDLLPSAAGCIKGVGWQDVLIAPPVAQSPGVEGFCDPREAQDSDLQKP